jgi:hypothetical protein
MDIFYIKIILFLSSLLIFSASAQAELSLATDAASAWAPAVIDASLERAAKSETSAMATDRSTILAAAEGSTSPALADIGLWHFISSVRAQQRGTNLVMLESSLRILEITTLPAVTAVPLPGAAWFLVMGLLGLVGVKATGRKAGYAHGSSGLGGSMPMPA